jgi:Ran GTPase-activating protein (RanGAP) involved in mRNA processing and transport
MIKTNAVKSENSAQELPTILEDEEVVTVEESTAPVEDSQNIDEVVNSLKGLLSALEKLQKVRLEVGDIKPLIGRMLDGEMVAGEDLEQLKVGVNGLTRLVRAYSDHQAALSKAQPARKLLDQMLKEGKTD